MTQDEDGNEDGVWEGTWLDNEAPDASLPQDSPSHLLSSYSCSLSVPDLSVPQYGD